MNTETTATAINGKWYRYLPNTINKNPKLALQQDEWYQVTVEDGITKIHNHLSKSMCHHCECPDNLCDQILDLEHPLEAHPGF